MSRTQENREKFARKLADEKVLYYKVNVEYDMSIKSETTINGMINHMKVNEKEHGVIYNSMNDTGQLPQLKKTATVTKDMGLSRLYYFATILNKRFDPNTGGAAMSENKSDNSPDYNFVYINKNRSNFLSLLNIIVHEIGHNMAAEHHHNTGNYEYNQKGLQSNQPDNIVPTPENSRTIINDQTNRSTITN